MPRQNHSIPDKLIFNYRFNLLTASAGRLSAPERRLADNVRRTISLFSGLSSLDVLFYDDKQCRSALLEYSDALGPELAKRFDQEGDGRLRSDMCRLAQLHRHGGYYFDTDIGLRFDLRTLVEPSTTFVTCTTTTAFPQNPAGFFQAFVGAAPRHPLLARALDHHLGWYASKERGDRGEIYRVTHNNHKPNVGTVLLRDAFIAWAGDRALSTASARGIVEHAAPRLRPHTSQLFFENRFHELGVGFERAHLASSPLCEFVVADRRSRKVPLVSRIYDQNAGVHCLPRGGGFGFGSRFGGFGGGGARQVRQLVTSGVSRLSRVSPLSLQRSRRDSPSSLPRGAGAKPPRNMARKVAMTPSGGGPAAASAGWSGRKHAAVKRSAPRGAGKVVLRRANTPPASRRGSRDPKS